MKYTCISADCHVDLIWLPPDLFTGNASPQMRERMPHVVEGKDGKGPRWVTRKGADFGRINGMGSGGRDYVPGVIHRSDRMAAEGLYEDGRKGIRRLTDPELRVKDQDRDGIQAEVLYGILGAAQRLQDPEAEIEVMRIYNEWLAEFCSARPERFAGLAAIPSASIDAAVAEIERVATRGVVRGIEVAITHDMKPLFHPDWDRVWSAANAAKLPVHFHTIGTPRPDWSDFGPLQQRQAFACYITGFQIAMARVVMEILYGGVLEAHPDVKIVIGESGIGWIPYLLDHMDLEWEEQFTDLTLKMKPSEYWHRQCYATYQSDKVGTRLLDMIGEENVMWGSDFPHPDGVWPDSQDYIQAELGHLPAALRHKVICANAARLYGFDA